MDFEIEFRPVGDASRAGDAIVVRYVEDGAYKIIVIDGGTDDCGDALCDHIRDTFGPDTIIDHVVNSHPDTDHACGLRKVLERFPVRNLWLHGIWHHCDEMLPYFADARWTVEGLANAIRRQYPVVEELINMAVERGIPVYEPYQGDRIGPFTVLSPSLHSYVRLVPQFRKTPESDNDSLSAEGWLLRKRSGMGVLAALAETIRSWIDERWDFETLREGAVTAAENESSVILHGDFGEKQVLLTADAGCIALNWACDYADRAGISLRSSSLVQVPHHGSRSNVTPSVLNRVLGPIQSAGSPATKIAIVSAPKDDTKHPRKIVMNAFHRRGAPVYATQGGYIRWHHGDMPARPGEGPLQPLGLFDAVEAYD